ncbi:type VII secretion protein EccE [Mycobacterium sp.]|uniref:type VII secretion protein EccE n=1 Tax=Mycobacterium sp. TaxID=1785 RepID=UPI003A879DE8
MKAQHRFGLSLSWPRLTTVFVVDVVTLVLAGHAPDSWQGENRVAWWVGVGIASLIALLSLVTYRGITVVSALIAWLQDWSTNPGTALGAGCTPATDFTRRFGRDTVGVREYGGRLVAAIQVEAGGGDHPGRHRHRSGTPAVLPVAVVADGLRQFDVHLDAIDIVSVEEHGAVEEAKASASLAEWSPEGWGPGADTADRHTPDRRRTWLVLRMNPQRNVDAVLCRDSLASTLVAAAERLVQDLDGHGCTAHPLTADEIDALDGEILADLEPTWSRPGWRYLKHSTGYVTSFWVTPADINSQTLSDVWLADAPEVGTTVVTVRLTTVAGRRRASAWVRYHSEARLPKALTAGLNRLTGRQLAAVRASMAAPASRPQLVVPSRELADHGAEHDELELHLNDHLSHHLSHEVEPATSSAQQ